MSSDVDAAAPRPARDHAGALERFAALRGRDGPEVDARSGSRLYDHGRRTPLAVVLVHGFTNAPEQWAVFAPRLHARGATVVVPRLPGHGHADRRATRIASVTGAEYLATVSEAVDVACGAGERVVLAGLSIGGAFAARLRQQRDDVDRAVCVVPFFGVARLGERANVALAAALGALPNAFVPWDPGGDGSATPAYGYPRFPTRGLGACVRVGLDALRDARGGAPGHGSIAYLLNAREPACNNALALALHARLAARGEASDAPVVLRDLPANHDVIDPTNPLARIGLVYPELDRLIGE